MAWSISDLFPSWGESGEQPPSGKNYKGGDNVNEKHLDYLWDSLYTFEDEVRTALNEVGDAFTVTDETATFTESDITVTHNNTEVNNGSVELIDYKVLFDLSGEDNIPTGMLFNDVGSKMYIVGNTSENIYSYNLSTNYDISTATYNQSFSVAGEDSSPTGMLFNDVGSKMYIVGNITESIYSYNLSTNYDISTASPHTTTATSGDVLVQYGIPKDIYEWDSATFQRTLDGETVTVDVEDDSGTVLKSDISRGEDLSGISTSNNIQLRANLSLNDTNNNPTIDYLARQYIR